MRRKRRGRRREKVRNKIQKRGKLQKQKKSKKWENKGKRLKTYERMRKTEKYEWNIESIACRRRKIKEEEDKTRKIEREIIRKIKDGWSW